MARLDQRHPAGAPGPWFVDSRCIDCDAARHVAPGLIARNPSDGVSVFTRQPATAEEVAMAWRAVLVCPTRSVGHVSERQPPPGVYPHDLGDGVHRLGHNASDSFGAHSYLVVRDDGNLMIDAPRWTRQLVEPIEALGGIAHVLLTHRDDVADADRYAERFDARVWIHADDRAAAPYATDVIDGTEPVEPTEGVVAVPVPGHTKGSVLYHVDGRLLFSGDSLAWDPRREQLTAFRRACWFSWDAQTASLDRFARSGLRFDRLFCGHGWSHDAPAERFHDHLVDLVARMPSWRLTRR
ncbi:Metallo-beta-lactamase superfamily protein [Euzebya pacifica]|uniref:Metallo-beta-lactamase superfamily protein n=1 Tax=Euzebya pacifica TaxID=1608957 RepID=A0A346XXD8_9ACTN|nr:MBL fold metallo-hydrolase [Euzebya pacifica]AXV06885.1 Metallo-beta-lactamase superfamily protein [Euzebya pacifica]